MATRRRKPGATRRTAVTRRPKAGAGRARKPARAAPAATLPAAVSRLRLPGESAGYRAARNALLQAEMELRRKLEAVAALRRELPPGGRVREDYLFEGTPLQGKTGWVRLSELFAPGRNTLAVYSFMFGPQMDRPCPSCTSILDALEGQVQHVTQRINFAVVAKSHLPRILAFARERGWRRLPLLSSAGNSFNRDYGAERPDGAQMPMLNVFVKRADGIRHFWGSELLYAPWEPGQEPRHVDLVWPLWNLFDLTPEGRGTDWHPRLNY